MSVFKKRLFSKIYPWLRQTFNAFRSDVGGNIALLFGLTLIPVIIAVGAAVDYSRASQVKTAMQTALDSTALHLGLLPQTSSQLALDTAAAEYFAANYQGNPDVDLGSIQVVKNGTALTLSVEAQLDTLFMGIVSISDMDVGAMSEVSLGGGTIEIALVLDNSGSMSGSKISALKSAARGLVQTLYAGLPPNSTDLSFALVPFATFVDIGESNKGAKWMAKKSKSSIYQGNFDKDVDRFKLFDNIKNAQWEGCVEARPYPHDVRDTEPDKKDPETLFVPAFAPDEPDGSSGYVNNYLPDKTSGSDEKRQENSKKYKKNVTANIHSVYGSHFTGPSFLCGQTDLTELTSSQAAIEVSLNSMIANGGTNIVQGLVWGWRTLSPAEPFTIGRAYNDSRNQKILILLTDGQNTYNGLSNQNGSIYSAYGFAKEGRLGTTSSSSSVLSNAMNGRTSEACTNIKAEGILVYTITFDLSDSATLQLMKNCATSPAYYYDSPGVSQLDDVFEEIASKLLKLRLTK